MSIQAANDPDRAARIAWRQAFDDQLTRQEMNRVLEYAGKRLAVVRRVLPHDKEHGATELVHEAIAATLAGTATWEPSTKPLGNHLIDTIAWQTRNTRRRLGRHRQASLDDTRDDTSTDGCRLENEATMKAGRVTAPPIDLHIAVHRVLDELRQQTAGDADVARLIETIRDGHTDHGDLMKATGLRAARFRNARRRLTRMAMRLPDETRAAVEAVLS